jgi:hypothetical protein
VRHTIILWSGCFYAICNRENESGLTIYFLPEAEEKYLMLEFLGQVLRHLTNLPCELPHQGLNVDVNFDHSYFAFIGTVQTQRTFPREVLKEGYPNLLVESPGKRVCKIS